MDNTMTLQFTGELKDGYMGGRAWLGCNYNGYMRYSDINKIVKKAFNDRYKGCGIDYKLSCTGSSFSMGQSCSGVLTVKLSDALCTLEEFQDNIEEFYDKNHFCFQVCHHLDRWDCDLYTTSYDDQVKILYDKYKRLVLAGQRMTYRDDLDKMIIKPQVYEMIGMLNAMYDSFNYEDINSMVDYFDVNFYKDVKLKCVE